MTTVVNCIRVHKCTQVYAGVIEWLIFLFFYCYVFPCRTMFWCIVFLPSSLRRVFEISWEFAWRMRSLENFLEFTQRLWKCEADDQKSRRVCAVVAKLTTCWGSHVFTAFLMCTMLLVVDSDFLAGAYLLQVLRKINLNCRLLQPCIIKIECLQSSAFEICKFMAYGSCN